MMSVLVDRLIWSSSSSLCSCHRYIRGTNTFFASKLAPGDNNILSDVRTVVGTGLAYSRVEEM